MLIKNKDMKKEEKSKEIVCASKEEVMRILRENLVKDKSLLEKLATM
jgi:hypothetical protein